MTYQFISCILNMKSSILMWSLVMICIVCPSFVGAKKVLIISSPMLSHMNEMNTIGAELQGMGHTTYQAVDFYFKSKDLKKVTESGIEPIFYKGPMKDFGMEDIQAMMKEKSMNEVMSSVLKSLYDQCRQMMEDKEFMDTLRKHKFDMMLIDGIHIAPCRYIVPYHLGVPYIFQMSAGYQWYMRVPVLPSFTPAFVGIDTFWHVTDKMSFFERVWNFGWMLMDLVIIPPPFTQDNSLLDEYAPGMTWGDLMRKSELFLITRDHMMEWPTIDMPNIITSSGITIEPAKPLPDDIEQIFSSAKRGVVIVSFGSTAGDLKESSMTEMFKALGQVKATVVMRFVGDIEAARKKAPSNLHLLSWMPQKDMLGHNNTVAFVTHCGNNGQYEALYQGVPMIGMPFMAEQHHNAFRMVSHGYGLKVNLDTFSAEELSSTITEVIEDPKYSTKTKLASAIMKSDPMLPREKLAYWVDHVMQFGGDHLRPACMDMTLTSLFMLDVLSFLGAIFIIFAACTYFCVKKLCCKTTKSKTE